MGLFMCQSHSFMQAVGSYNETCYVCGKLWDLLHVEQVMKEFATCVVNYDGFATCVQEGVGTLFMVVIGKNYFVIFHFNIVNFGLISLCFDQFITLILWLTPRKRPVYSYRKHGSTFRNSSFPMHPIGCSSSAQAQQHVGSLLNIKRWFQPRQRLMGRSRWNFSDTTSLFPTPIKRHSLWQIIYF